MPQAGSVSGTFLRCLCADVGVRTAACSTTKNISPRMYQLQHPITQCVGMHFEALKELGWLYRAASGSSSDSKGWRVSPEMSKEPVRIFRRLKGFAFGTDAGSLDLM